MKDLEAIGFHMPTEVLFGEGISRRTGEQALALGRKALLVTGRSSAEKSGASERMLPSLRSAGVEFDIYDGVEPNPTCETLAEGADAARSFGARLIIGVGGGSPLDAAKGIAVLATNEGRPDRYFGEEPSIPPLPILAVPTTAGTGSEVTPYAVIVDGPAKKTIRSSGLFPRVALVDPELTYSMPPSITADTGMDALSHAVEGILCSRRNSAASHIAMEAVRLTLKHLRQAYDSPQDTDARAGMCAAALLAGVVIAQTGTELIHTMGYTLTLDFGVPHGRANAMLIPAVLRLYSPSNVLGWMCKALGGERVSDKRTGEFIAREIEELNRDVGIEASLGREVRDEDIASFAKAVLANERKMANCHRLPTLDEVKSVFARVLR
jgi:alcohol dehydrogenase class IV